MRLVTRTLLREVLIAEVFVLNAAKAFCDPLSHLLHIVICLDLNNYSDSVSAVIVLIKRPQIVPQRLLILAFDALVVPPGESIEHVLLVLGG